MRKGWKRVHRLVVLPDYQGIGIGTAFQDLIVEKYAIDGWEVNCTTTTPSLAGALRRSDKWRLIRFGRVTNVWGNKGKFNSETSKVKGSSSKRITYSFVFKK